MVGVKLTQDTATRLIKAARKQERQGPQRANDRVGPSGPSPKFWAEIESEDPGNPGRYSWHLVYFSPTDANFIPANPTVDSAGLYTAWEANQQSGDLEGQRVELSHYGYDDGEKPIYLFFAGSTSIPTGMYQYENFTMVSQNQSGWGYQLAHP